MADIVLRGQVKDDGIIELLDPLPEGFDAKDEVSVIFKQKEIIETNEYGDEIIIDEMNGMISPVNPLTTEELLNSSFVGLWEHRKEEFGDSAE